MALPFIKGPSKSRDDLLSIDLGGRTTKAVHLQKRGDRVSLLRYAVVEAPVYEKNLSVDLLSEHLKGVYEALDAKTKSVTLALSVQDAIVRHADMPMMPIGDMRQVLKMNSKAYLQQELPGYVYDCFVIPSAHKQPEKGKTPSGLPKMRVLVAGARNQLINDLQAAVKAANFSPDYIVPGLIGPVNAFEQAMPEIFAKEVVALVEFGFKHSSICILDQGELELSRVVAIGGDRLTSGLAESLGISYAEAEGIKIGMPSEVQSNLDSLVLPLGRELRASIDFFEHQQDKPVTHVFVSGGLARSESILQTLAAELMAECKLWNPLSSLQLDLPPQQAAEVEHVTPQLAVAVGAGISSF